MSEMVGRLWIGGGLQLPGIRVMLALLGLIWSLGVSAPSSFAAGSANRASCPIATESSPGYRVYLPDCRAYELVTPPFMAGFDLRVQVKPEQENEFASDRFLFQSFASLAETEGSPPTLSGPLYGAGRSDEGWTTAALTPAVPGAFEIEPEVGIVEKATMLPSADGTAVAWRMRDLSEGGSRNSIYIRQGTGPVELIGPATDEPGSVNGAGERTPKLGQVASSDLSRIPLSAKLTSAVGSNKWLWPGDTTLTINNNDTLYEYDLSEPNIGTVAAEPKLVGVKNAGRLTSNTEAQLISQCGTVLGGGFNPRRVARSISEDGQYLFFTAQKKTGCAGTQPRSSEMYARVNGEETVPVSNPSEVDCAACLSGVAKETAEKAVEAANLQAIYQGASTDGTKVFFTSFQELFAGIKGSVGAPNLYRYDFEAPAGQKLELVSKVASGSAEVQPPPARYTGISATGEQIYFIAKKVLATNESKAYDPLTEGLQKAEEGKLNLYTWEAPKDGEEARTSFIAQLPSNTNPMTTPDGRFLVFSTTAQLVESNESTVEQLFEYDSVSGALVRVSVGDQGFNDNGNTDVNPVGFKWVVSADGRRVFFESSNALTPGALNDPTNTFANIYEWTWEGEQPGEADARVFLILSAPANGTSGGRSSSLEGIDPSGDNVYFSTLERLVPQHANTQAFNVYTARVEGGFPGIIEEASCDGDACQGLPSIGTGSTSLASAAFAGSGNTNHRRRSGKRCGKGKRRVGKANSGKVRCVPRKGKRNRRIAGTNQGAGR